MNAYNQAVENRYRFFSFGDSMIIRKWCLKRHFLI
jgi:S-adenosylmethionine:tRNA-ribosyltransferase-isomerase (queuine synthetase)